jgi:hypothetical protein
MLIVIIGCDRPAIPKQVIDERFIEDEWEVEDSLWGPPCMFVFHSKLNINH